MCLYLSKAADNNSMPENDFFFDTQRALFSVKKTEIWTNFDSEILAV